MNEQYFTSCSTIKDLTKERNRLARLYHPDKGGDVKVMQEINVQFEVAKKRLLAPDVGRAYAPSPMSAEDIFQWVFNNLQKNVDDAIHNACGQSTSWTPKETRQQKWRRERDEREAKERADRKEEFLWAISQIRLANQQGLLRNCQTHVNMGQYLFVKGNTGTYRKWFEEHGFIWDAKLQQWNFDKRPNIKAS